MGLLVWSVVWASIWNLHLRRLYEHGPEKLPISERPGLFMGRLCDVPMRARLYGAKLIRRVTR